MKKLLIIGSVWPEPTSTAAGKRMLQLISLFQKQNFEITFCSTASKSEHSFDLNLLSVSSKNILLNDSGFDDFVKNLQPKIVIFDRFMAEEQFGWRVSENCPEAIKILDTEDLHFLRKQREISFKNKQENNPQNEISEVFIREVSSILRCDLSLIISDFEQQLLIENYKINSKILYYLPMFSEKFEGEISEFQERKNFLHIGNFLHEPNWQTVLILKKLWKNIKQKLPESELHIYGSYVTEKAKQLHNEKEGFIIKGRANSAEEIFLNYKVLIAPIPFGAGIKGKLLESMEFGLPNVTTIIGAEGMQINEDWNGFITNSDEEFIEKAILLYTNSEVWGNSQNFGFEILKQKFNRDLFENDFNEKVKYIYENLNDHRNQNFLGQILQKNALQSTKFMSKWIEEKNKKK
ncbi:glycosyltransferase [Halpernia sp.]|uniref:glycosyltransferase n=1 Tax=Halpernia sp. TaxID=2782209 RepID=UPI003A907628